MSCRVLALLCNPSLGSRPLGLNVKKFIPFLASNGPRHRSSSGPPGQPGIKRSVAFGVVPKALKNLPRMRAPSLINSTEIGSIYHLQKSTLGTEDVCPTVCISGGVSGRRDYSHFRAKSGKTCTIRERRSRCLLGDGVGLIFVFLSFCFHIPKIFIHDFKTNRFIETYCWHIRNTNRDAYAVHRGMFSATYIQVECLL